MKKKKENILFKDPFDGEYIGNIWGWKNILRYVQWLWMNKHKNVFFPRFFFHWHKDIELYVLTILNYKIYTPSINRLQIYHSNIFILIQNIMETSNQVNCNVFNIHKCIFWDWEYGKNQHAVSLVYVMDEWKAHT